MINPEISLPFSRWPEAEGRRYFGDESVMSGFWNLLSYGSTRSTLRASRPFQTCTDGRGPRNGNGISETSTYKVWTRDHRRWRTGPANVFHGAKGRTWPKVLRNGVQSDGKTTIPKQLDPSGEVCRRSRHVPGTSEWLKKYTYRREVGVCSSFATWTMVSTYHDLMEAGFLTGSCVGRHVV